MTKTIYKPFYKQIKFYVSIVVLLLTWHFLITYVVFKPVAEREQIKGKPITIHMENVTITTTDDKLVNVNGKTYLKSDNTKIDVTGAEIEYK